MAVQKSLLPTRRDDFSAWYNTLVKKAGLVDDAHVRGCMILKPYAFALWEQIQKILDDAFKRMGHQNAYFPLFIPLSHLGREADHVEGFAKECAVVTHYRLRSREGSGIVPDARAVLEEPLVVRPTSETVIWDAYSRWIQSYRDLPLRLNQWANVVRWEMRTRPFIRTAEILWQEGHTAHATAAEAERQAREMHDLYANFIGDYLAIPVVKGEKSAHERFAGAVKTYTLEALMQDGKALQLGTSHFLGQNFAKAFNVRFLDRQGALQYVWGTSWGVTTRLIGALIMTHGDDKGLVLPPKIAPTQVIIVPIRSKDGREREAIVRQAQGLKVSLEAQGIRVAIDTRDTHSPGWKFAAYELQGIPVRLTIGPRDLAGRTVEVARRDGGDKYTVAQEGVVDRIGSLLEEIQQAMFKKAKAFQEAHTWRVGSYEDFTRLLGSGEGGFVLAHWDGTTATEKEIQAQTQATLRCIPLGASGEEGRCIYSGRRSQGSVYFAKAY